MTCCANKKRTWRFYNSEQTTASNTLREIVGFYGELFISFEGVLQGTNVLDPNAQPVVTSTPSTGVTIGTPSPEDDLLTISIPVSLDIVGTYQFIVTGVSLNGEETTRRATLVVESLTGT